MVNTTLEREETEIGSGDGGTLLTWAVTVV